MNGYEYSYKDLVADAYGTWSVGYSIGSAVDTALDESYVSLGRTGEEWLKLENKTKKEFQEDVINKIKTMENLVNVKEIQYVYDTLTLLESEEWFVLEVRGMREFTYTTSKLFDLKTEVFRYWFSGDAIMILTLFDIYDRE